MLRKLHWLPTAPLVVAFLPFARILLRRDNASVWFSRCVGSKSFDALSARKISPLPSHGHNSRYESAAGIWTRLPSRMVCDFDSMRIKMQEKTLARASQRRHLPKSMPTTSFPAGFSKKSRIRCLYPAPENPSPAAEFLEDFPRRSLPRLWTLTGQSTGQRCGRVRVDTSVGEIDLARAG